MAELHVDDLLNSFDSRNANNKGAKDTKVAKKPANNDWDEQEEDNFALGIGRTEQATKAKTTKKKTTAKGWGDIDAAPQQPTVQDFATIQDGEKKKKIFNKPNGQPKVPVNFEAEAESFPSLGEDRPKQAPKKPEPTPVAQPTSTSSSGIKKFVNAKKQGTGETFAPLEPVQEKAIPVIPEKTEPAVQQQQQQQKPAGFGFQRRAAEEQPKEVAPPVDTKFKFGGEGPKKFGNGGKISFKREEEKSEQERAREEKEREIEERLAREREELAKQRDQKKSDSPKTKLEKTEKVETVETTETTEQPVEEKRIAKFSNSKKKAEPVVEKKVEVVQEVAPEVKPSGPVENVEMKGTLSNKAWGDGPLIKKSQKK